ncbi:hypothetical protein BGAL_0549g00020 [Botrytis galanthina]|uniref:Uncharacterized protein n=1 Tax=Botrytis galanthina TaxID=278940 RepID=A0A4S8QU02_9HELO|nr:hypothetical protein BGAL_0549g00020 [Botrytis galanthina]
MASPETNFPIDESTTRSNEKEAIDTSQPFTCGERVDGPLLLALLMGNNNANEWAAAQPASENPVSDTLNPNCYALELGAAGNDDKEAMASSQSFAKEEGTDGPLLLTLLMGNNNNNASAQAAAQCTPAEAVSDTLNPDYYALELSSDVNDDEGIDINASSTDGEDGPLLFGLLLNNQNNNNGKDPALNNVNNGNSTLSPSGVALELKPDQNDIEGTAENGSSSIDGEDGPLLFALLLNNRNNNNCAPNIDPNAQAKRAISDTLDPRSVALELKFPVSNDVDINDISVDTSGEDGPIAFALLLGNQNNNAAANPQIQNNGTPIADSLDPRSVTLELNTPVGESAGINHATVETSGEDGPLIFALMLGNQNNNAAPNPQIQTDGNPIADSLDSRQFTLELDAPQDSSANDTDQFISEGDGPLLLTMLLANQNQNNGNKAVEAAMKQPIADTLDPSDTITEAIPDVMEMKTQLLELHPSKDTITEAIPDVMEMKTQLLELHSPGNDEANSIPVMLKVNSQAQKEQILAMLQGRSIPVAIASNNTKGGFANGTLDRAQVTAANLQSKPHVALNEARNGNLSDEQLQFWRENGYLVIPDTLSASQKDNLLKTVHEAAQVLAGGGERVQKHAYLPGQKSYVTPVGRAIATLSEHGFNPDVEPLKRIQRIGCGVHRVMPPFRKAILSPFHSTLARSLGYKDPCIYQSLIIVKAAEVGARVIPHQDGCSGFTNPSSCTTFWYALEDCSTENGCLAVAPGSHRVEPITRRCVTNGNGQPVFTDLEKPVYADIKGVDDSTLPKKNEKGEFEYKKLEVKAGTLILMHGNLMHKSEANRSSKSRVAFNFGVVEGEHGWLEDNYLQPYEGTTEFEKL